MSRQVCEWLDRGPFSAHVLAAFDRACDLVTGDGKVIALVSPQVGDGPLNIVLDRAGGFDRLRVGTKVTRDAGRLFFFNGAVGDSVEVDLQETALWEPCPDWDRLRARLDEMLPALHSLRSLCLAGGASSVLLPLLDTAPSMGTWRLGECARQAAADLRAGWGEVRCQDRVSVRRGGAALAGLGGGLTPAGDDFLVGLMLWAWLAHPAPRPFCRALVEEAAPRTTTLSAAFLRAAARGQCSAAWQRLLYALAEGAESDVVSAGRQVLSFGASSGADALIGFLYMSC